MTEAPQLARLPIGDLVSNPRNPRKHPEEQLARLMASLRRDGQTKPVLARAANRMLIAGHGVTEAARRLGLPELVVMLWDVDQATADRVMLADNRLAELSAADHERVAELLGEIEAADHFAAGFSPDEVAKLMASFDEQISVAEISTSEVRDDFWINLRGPLPRQADVLARVKLLLGEYPDVQIDLGTVAAG